MHVVVLLCENCYNKNVLPYTINNDHTWLTFVMHNI